MEDEMKQLKTLISKIGNDQLSDAIPILNTIVEAKAKKMCGKVIAKNFARDKVKGDNK